MNVKQNQLLAVLRCKKMSPFCRWHYFCDIH